jgi:tetratricopeptide (TPR) repeat protein
MPRVASLLALVFLALSSGAQPLFWEAELTRALDMRDSFYRSAGVDSGLFAAMQRADRRLVLQIPAPDTASPWFYFLSGIACVQDSSDAASRSFTKALNAAEKDPGETFALALEFGRCNQLFWQEKSLKKLYLLFLTSNAQSAPLVSQMLLWESIHSARGHGEQASRSRSARSWAAAFDRHCLWPGIFSMKDEGFLNIPKAASLARNLIGTISASWELQLDLTRQWYRWFILACMVFVFVILLGIGAKYLPQALHSVSERLSDAYRPKVKLALTFIVYFSLLFLGIIPFLWITFFVLWRHLRARDKTLAGIALFLVLLYPLSIRFTDMLESCSAPGSPVMLLRKAIDEGYYQALDSSITTLVKKDPGDCCAHTAAAILNLKKGDVASAYPHVRAAQRLSHLDPAVIVTTGNSLYFAGDLAGARSAYQECIKLYPSYEPAYFNLGQYYFNSMETAKGMEYITQAAKLNPAYINSFIKTNDDNFSKDWPLVRQLIQPDYAPQYFWKNIFPGHAGSWRTANDRFGVDCLGMPILLYGGISLFLLVMLMILDTFVWSKDMVRKIYVCKLCQTPICRKCKRGGICQDCFNSTQHIRNENIRQRIMGKIQLRSRRFHVIIATFLDMLFPGSGMLYSSAPLYRTLPVLVATSVVYGSYLTLLQPSLHYPACLFHSIVMPLFIGCCVYNSFFIVRTVTQLFRELKPRGE